MKQTNKPSTNTSFHRVVFNATVQQLTDMLGKPAYSPNDGKDKVNYEWEMETDNGDVFTVYDWKEYRPISATEVIAWHIGAHSEAISNKALGELTEALSVI